MKKRLLRSRRFGKLLTGFWQNLSKKDLIYRKMPRKDCHSSQFCHPFWKVRRNLLLTVASNNGRPSKRDDRARGADGAMVAILYEWVLKWVD